ncbi:MAG: leucine-rich repeat domain-containing protein [Holosporales bacterium]|jgi:hypothetical protein|nr:leucine-rich repeat domain-containing protein [Holosporales bacterium]
MNILKIGLVAAVLWQSNAGYAEFLGAVSAPPSSAVRQLCEEIINNGNIAYKHLDEVEFGSMGNPFRIDSNWWYILQGVNRILEDVVVHPDLLPFLRYRYDRENITGVELFCNANANIPNDVLQKAIALSPSATHINIPMRKLPYLTPKPWMDNLLSLSAPGLKHVRGWAFRYEYDDVMQSIDISAAESIGECAFCSRNSINSLKLSNALKFINYDAHVGDGLSVNVPSFTHFLTDGAFGHGTSLAIADLLRFSDSPFGYCSIINITCYSRINNIRSLLDRISNSIDTEMFETLNIRFNDSIKHVVTVDYINEILAVNKEPLDLLVQMFDNGGCGFLDISNIEISEGQLSSIERQGDVPWVLSFPHITTVNNLFNDLFRDLHGVILFDAESVTEGSFDGCSNNISTLGFVDSCSFVGTPLAGLAPSILELTITQPQNILCFLGVLEGAGLDLSSVERFNIKFSDAVAKDANLGHYVASLLTALPSSNFSGASALSSINGIFYFNLTNSNISNIYDLPINEFSREHSCIFILPDESRHFLQSNNETTIGWERVDKLDGGLIRGVIISNNVTEIPDYAFYSMPLTFVTIPNSVTTIGSHAFYGTRLTSVAIPNSVTTIGDGAFRLAPLTSVTIPNSVTTIGDGAFSNTRLTSITIPDSVTYLGGFDGTQLTSVTIPDSVTTIGADAFYGTQLTSITIPNSVTTIGEWAFARTPLTSVTIPNSVTTIGEWAFGGTQLTSVTIPNSVTTIGSLAFYGTQLTSVTIPDSVTTIGNGAFDKAPIQSIKVNCQPSGKGLIAILSKVLNGFTTWQETTIPSVLNTLQVALSPSLLAAKNSEQLKSYVLGILSITNPTNNAIISAIAGKQEKLFELDLSNTDLVQADIDSMTKTLPWTVVFKNGDRVTYES